MQKTVIQNVGLLDFELCFVYSPEQTPMDKTEIEKPKAMGTKPIFQLEH
jgi:hypothetical protein